MSSEPVHGVVSAGGTGNTSLASAVMRAVLPIGLPKLIVSTNASSDVSAVVGEADITMMPSIVDIAGSNQLLKRILSNAAGAIVGMGRAYESAQDENGSQGKQRKRIAISMFGVWTHAPNSVRVRRLTNCVRSRRLLLTKSDNTSKAIIPSNVSSSIKRARAARQWRSL